MEKKKTPNRKETCENLPKAIEAKPLLTEVANPDEWQEAQRQCLRGACEELTQAACQVLETAPHNVTEKVDSIEVTVMPRVFVVPELKIKANLKG